MSAIRVTQTTDSSLTFISPINERNLIRMCKNLLIVDSDNHWRFFHLSAREYLDNKVGFDGKSQQTHLFCAEICFRSLSSSFGPQSTNFAKVDPTKDSSDPFEDPFHPENPFSLHCQVYWPFYARTKVQRAPHLPFLEEFLGSPTDSHSLSPLWLAYARRLGGEGDGINMPFAKDSEAIISRSRSEDISGFSIFVVAYFNLYETLHEWCDNSDMSPFQQTGAGDYLLSIAAQSGCVSFCAALIARGRASVTGDFPLCLSEALVSAADRGNRSMVEYLIKEGADVNIIPEFKGVGQKYSSPVDAAARNGNLDLVKYLVEYAGAVVRDALTWAAEADSGLGITKYLIENQKIDPNLPPLRRGFQSPLIVAAAYHQRDTFQYYLDETNVDVNAADPNAVYYNALQAIIGSGSLDDVKYFVEKGKANIHVPYGYEEYGNALLCALRQRRLDIVKYLVEEAGADVNLQLKLGCYGTILINAVAPKYHEMIDYLAPYANVNLPAMHGEYGSALATAFYLSDSAMEVDMDVVRLLIKEGADVNLQHQTGRYGSPFVAAAFFVHDLDIIQYLVDECGADIHARHTTGIYRSALAAAAHGGNLSVVKYLISSGEDPNLDLQSGTYGSVLCAASAAANCPRLVEIVEYLVDSGAYVNLELQAGTYGSALVAAAANENLEVVRFLVEKGKADVDLRLEAGRFGSALTAAAASLNLELVEYLVEERKANINLLLETGSFGSPLTAATLVLLDFPIDVNLDRDGWTIKNFNLKIDFVLEIEADAVLRLALSSIIVPSDVREDVFRVVQYLVNAGVDVNVKSRLTTGSFGSALVVAITADSKLRKLSSDDIFDFVRVVYLNVHHAGLWGPGLEDDEAQAIAKSTENSMIDIMTYLLDSGAPVDQQLVVGPYGSALAAAAAVGSLWSVKFLVEEWNADVNLQLENGSYTNAYEAAVANGHDEIAEYLMQKGSDYEIIGAEPLD